MASSFTVPQRILHWLMAALILFNLLFTDAMETAGRLMFRGQTLTPEQVSSANIHVYVGIGVLVLGLIRLCLRLVQGVPPEPRQEPPLLRAVAKISHWAFYALFIAIPLAGIGAWYFGNKTAAFVHTGPLKLLMWALIVAHIGGALVHQFYWKTDALKRMTSG
ncbi:MULTISPECIES: cytochrome b [unclassified Neorhizobium]|uniref:cytochrome b n=1 Tax=unclassified Neorhizobium TaxID=2629175 RepID=UPI001FF42C29|nr:MULTISPECIES: cytochrome b [unclassified Neorhizobium]MCJ9674208.1 cytochrome b [Neorhizobium sp. SHOUNA12B]MCJ9747469.1 cytochrome b [Neorhizobium sp. SHOUNA12A]